MTKITARLEDRELEEYLLTPPQEDPDFEEGLGAVFAA